MIKKFTLLMVALLLSFMGAKADVIESEQIIWSSNDTFYDEVGITYDKFSGADGKKVRVNFTPCKGGGSLNIVCKETTNWTEVSQILSWGWQSAGTLCYDFSVDTNIQNPGNQTFFSPGSTNLLKSESSFIPETGSTYTSSTHVLNTTTASTGFSYTLSSQAYASAVILKTSADALLTITVTYSDETTAVLAETSATSTHKLTLNAEKQVKSLSVKNQNTGEVTISSFNLYNLMIDSITLLTTTTLDKSSLSGTTNIYSGSHDLDNYSGLGLTDKTCKDILENAKIGDVLRATYTSDEAGYINFCNGSGWATLIGGSFSVATTSVAATVEYEIVSATVLEAIKQNGIAMNGTNAVLSAVDLLTYSSSYDAVSITVGSDGVATYSNGNKNVQISACDALKAYYASAVAKGIVTLTELTGCIPASKGVIVYGSEGTYTVPVGGEGWPGDFTNYLKPTGNNSQSVAASVGGAYHYIFAKDKTNSEIGFYKLEADHTLAAHKAYLETPDDCTPSAVGGARGLIRLSFGGGEGTTAINTALKNPIVEDGLYYTLQGVAVKNPSKGIYILNGKKVFVK